MEFSITWTIELSAESHKEAAEIALDSIINGTAKVFHVKNTITNEEKLVDLDNINNLIRE
jgi:hypothetical protein